MILINGALKPIYGELHVLPSVLPLANNLLIFNDSSNPVRATKASRDSEGLFSLVAVKAKLSRADKGKSCDREAVVGPSGNVNAEWISPGIPKGDGDNPGRATEIYF